MEVGTLIRVPDDPQAAPGQAGGYQIPVSIKGGTYQALVDSGCNQTSVHQSLILSGALDASRLVKVRCVHRDVVRYPLVPVIIQFRGQKHSVEVAVNPHLRHPIILGTNWPAFNKLLGCLCLDASWEDAKNWDKWLEPLLFAVREVPQASTGFSPFELLFGHQPRGVLDVLRETWEDGPSQAKNEIQYVLDLRTKLHTLGRLSMENLLQAQHRQSQLYDRGTNLRKFSPGDKVLVLLPTSSSKLLAKWQGPFVVTRQLGELDYEVVRSDRRGARQIYHLNLLKKWNEAESVMLATVISGEDDLGPEANIKKQSLALAPGGDHLSPSQLTDLSKLQAEFADVFSPLPGRTNLIQHHIETEPGVVVRSRPYRLPEHKKNVVQAELGAMLEMGVIEESSSNWASPIVLVPKTDGSVRFCVDYRKVNTVSKFDAYPMPRVDELLDRLGTARFYSTLDLTKGYWQIPLSPLSKEKTAFTTPFGLHQFVTLPFGLLTSRTEGWVLSCPRR
ncbi:uncharacterized protein LOC125263947 [Megalobrama amblycephala]|uniref:uncharacterized protein LOC125263947 n=1 Tax=Megalobrama amblycephala TaxID=75352 RepID=UPI0020143213|nr:uncharacterized protein LOC125263947 [Megalobrama amblycephala]